MTAEQLEAEVDRMLEPNAKAMSVEEVFNVPGWWSPRRGRR
jgi:hypothetical protein